MGGPLNLHANGDAAKDIFLRVQEKAAGLQQLGLPRGEAPRCEAFKVHRPPPGPDGP